MHATPTSADYTLTVMPDYGNGPYAWLKSSKDTTQYVGQCVATAVHGFELDDGTTISPQLQGQFSEWTAEFECRAHKPGFPWVAFHLQGIELSRRLKQELGPNYRVIYLKPCEDPDREVDEYTLV
jgi:hypothetical protein